MPDNVMPIIGLGLVLLVTAVYLAQFLRSKLATAKTVRAVVVNKQTVETVSKYSGNGKHIRYCVTFQVENKRLSFDVSEFSYRGYRLSESGKLTYKGNKLIDFR